MRFPLGTLIVGSCIKVMPAAVNRMISGSSPLFRAEIRARDRPSLITWVRRRNSISTTCGGTAYASSSNLGILVVRIHSR